MEEKNKDKGLVLANVSFLLADVLESCLIEANDEMAKNGSSFKHEAKRLFGLVLKSIKNLKAEFIRTSSSEVQDIFGYDADIMYNMIKLLVDRCSDKKEISEKIFRDIEAEYSSLIGLKVENCYED